MRTLFAILTLALFSFSCEKEEVTILPVPQDQVNLELHAIFSCGNEFDLAPETPEEWGQRIVDAVTAEGVTILNFNVAFMEVENPGFCGNCAPTGDILRVSAPPSAEEELRALGFR
ncbi:MAG: hypothetical protein AAFZ63_12150 [Bacteroidota bacterium]